MTCARHARKAKRPKQQALQKRVIVSVSVSDGDVLVIAITYLCNLQRFSKAVKMIFLDEKIRYFSYIHVFSKHIMWVHVRTASMRRF